MNTRFEWERFGDKGHVLWHQGFIRALIVKEIDEYVGLGTVGLPPDPATEFRNRNLRAIKAALVRQAREDLS